MQSNNRVVRALRVGRYFLCSKAIISPRIWTLTPLVVVLAGCIDSGEGYQDIPFVQDPVSDCQSSVEMLSEVDQAGNYRLSVRETEEEGPDEYVVSYLGISCIFSFVQYEAQFPEVPPLYNVVELTIPQEFESYRGITFQRFVSSPELRSRIIRLRIDDCLSESAFQTCQSLIDDFIAMNTAEIRVLGRDGYSTISFIETSVFWSDVRIN